MQIQSISNNNSFKGLYLDKKLLNSIENSIKEDEYLSKYNRRLAKKCSEDSFVQLLQPKNKNTLSKKYLKSHHNQLATKFHNDALAMATILYKSECLPTDKNYILKANNTSGKGRVSFSIVEQNNPRKIIAKDFYGTQYNIIKDNSLSTLWNANSLFQLIESCVTQLNQHGKLKDNIDF